MSRPRERRREAKPGRGASPSGKPQPAYRRRAKGRVGRGSGRFLRGLALFFALAALCVMTALGALFAWSVSPGAVVGEGAAGGEGTAPIHFEVKSADKGAVIEQLAETGLLTAPLLTKLYALLLTPTASFEPRSHLLARGNSARELVQRLSELGSRPRAKVTFPEGWTHMQMAKRLEEAHICSEVGFRSAVAEETLLRELRLTDSAEGYLFPAGYEFLVDSDPRQIVRRMVTEARRRIAAVKQSGAPQKDLEMLGFGEAEIVTLASIVEKETSAAEEAPRVARVFLNRLLLPEAETKGRLQSDPTAAYGCLIDPSGPPSCARYQKWITPEMLDDAANPYNTYRHAGLPPGPISNPGERALSAVLRPADGPALYFVADGTGAHTFSETYVQHRKAVEVLRALKKPRENE